MEPNSTKTAQEADKKSRKQPSQGMLLFWTFVVGIVVFAIGLGLLIYADTPIFAIPLVLSVPVIAAVAFRNMWD